MLEIYIWIIELIIVLLLNPLRCLSILKFVRPINLNFSLNNIHLSIYQHLSRAYSSWWWSNIFEFLFINPFFSISFMVPFVESMESFRLNWWTFGMWLLILINLVLLVRSLLINWETWNIRIQCTPLMIIMTSEWCHFMNSCWIFWVCILDISWESMLMPVPVWMMMLNSSSRSGQ